VSIRECKTDLRLISLFGFLRSNGR
jgi:hypothetical protein